MVITNNYWSMNASTYLRQTWTKFSSPENGKNTYENGYPPSWKMKSFITSLEFNGLYYEMPTLVRKTKI